MKIGMYRGIHNTVYTLVISDLEMARLSFSPEEQKILDKAGKNDAPFSYRALGLALLARKVEELRK